MNRGGAAAAKPSGKVLTRGVAEDVGSLADATFPHDDAKVVSKLLGGKVPLVKREVSVGGRRYVAFAVYGHDDATTLEVTMKFDGSQGVTLVDASDAPQKGLTATVSVSGKAVGVVARLRLEPSNLLKMKLACKHSTMMGGAHGPTPPPGARPRSKTGDKGRPRSRTKRKSGTNAAFAVADMYAGLE